jgi:RNA methyltransferase, TrmH family
MHLIESYRSVLARPEELVVSESGLRAPRSRLSGRRFIREGQCFGDVLFDELATVETPSGIMASYCASSLQHGLNQEADAVLLDGSSGSWQPRVDPAKCSGGRVSGRCCCLRIALRPGPEKFFGRPWARIFCSISTKGATCRRSLPATGGNLSPPFWKTQLALHSLDLTHPVAWVFGSEGIGRPAGGGRLAKRRVRIPMPGKTESLNVAAAAAVCLFETVRQRLRGAA